MKERKNKENDALQEEIYNLQKDIYKEMLNISIKIKELDNLYLAKNRLNNNPCGYFKDIDED